MTCLRLLLLLLLAQASVLAQTPDTPAVQPRPSQPPATTSPATHQITIDVVVKDKSGAPVRGLQKEDFNVLDEKQPRPIQSFVAADDHSNPPQPVEVVLVLDSVNTSFRSITQIRDPVKGFLLQNNGKLDWPVSMILFSPSGTKAQAGSSRDGNALAAVFDQYEPGLQPGNITNGGRWGAVERMDNSVNTLKQIAAFEKAKPGRKLLIWFSRSWPMLSDTNIRLTNQYLDNLFNSVTSLSAELRQARITVYSIDPIGAVTAGTLRNSYYEGFLKPPTAASHVLPGDLGLQVLAVQTGGRVFTSSNDVATSIRESVSDAAAYYTLSFDSAKADQANEYHSIEVKVNKPGATARTRTGYYAQP